MASIAGVGGVAVEMGSQLMTMAMPMSVMLPVLVHM